VFGSVCRCRTVCTRIVCVSGVCYGVLYDSGDLYKDAVFGFMCRCRTVCTRIVCVSGMCACWADVHVYEQILQLYPDERCKKKR
jgi:hypothetical protein